MLVSLASAGPSMEPSGHPLTSGDELQELEDSEDTTAKPRGGTASGGASNGDLKQICIDLTDNSGPMVTFIESAPPKSLLFMVTQDDGASR